VHSVAHGLECDYLSIIKNMYDKTGVPGLPFSFTPIREKKAEQKRKETGNESPAFPQYRVTGLDI
jgi:hypothetical protein